MRIASVLGLVLFAGCGYSLPAHQASPAVRSALEKCGEAGGKGYATLYDSSRHQPTTVIVTCTWVFR